MHTELSDKKWIVTCNNNRWTVSHPDIKNIEGSSEESIVAAKRMVMYLNIREIQYQKNKERQAFLRKQREESNG